MFSPTTDQYCPTHSQAFAELDEIAPGVPLLALGQTPLWDEPLKAGVVHCLRASGSTRKFIVGVHDTDYFARHASAKRVQGDYALLPHNDTTTKELWSAAGEFSALFGSETVISKETLVKAGTRWARIQKERPGHLDEMTEAFGWRGVVGTKSDPITISQVKLEPVFGAIQNGLNWAISETISMIPGCKSKEICAKSTELQNLLLAAKTTNPSTLAEFYQALLPKLYEFVSGESLEIDTTRTTQLLKFNSQTCCLKRFELVNYFLNPQTRSIAEKAYNDALGSGEIYTLDRFGSFALPFDVVIPGIGRGTLRVSRKAIIIMTSTPQFITTKIPVTTIEQLASFLEKRFGEDCTLVGKAVSLIGMLATEHIFVFHEGASSYVHLSRKFHQKIIENGFPYKINPILRVKYHTWESIGHCDMWLKLPEVLRQPFGAEEISTKSFAGRLEQVVERQHSLINELSKIRRSIELVEYLASNFSSSWSSLATEYAHLQQKMSQSWAKISDIRNQKDQILIQMRLTKAKRNSLEHEKGLQWRAEIFEQNPDKMELLKRQNIIQAIKETADEINQLSIQWRELQNQQDHMVRTPEVLEVRDRIRGLELEAELKRLKLLRQAITCTKGLVKAGHRPSAWWFPLVCPDNGWFKQTTASSEYYLESIS